MFALFGCSSIPRGRVSLRWRAPSTHRSISDARDEIARFHTVFEKSVVGATAEYSLRGDGKIQVVNSGFKNSLDGAYTEVRAVAWVPDPTRPAALKVRFFGLFPADYLIFGLDQDSYTWALVGEDSRDYLWFLSRTPQIDDALFNRMKDLAAAQGYDMSRLYTVPQKAR